MSLVSLIANELRLDESYIQNIANKSHHYYRHYRIPKKSGGYRDIYHPSPELKTIQYWLIKRIFSLLPISIYATAYKNGSSIKKNASMHLGAAHIIRVDIKNFFESITSNHLRTVINNNEDLLSKNGLKLDVQDKEFIEHICFYFGHLKVGAVSSPIISNIVMYDFDLKLYKALRKKSSSFIYTRYADDVYVSSKRRIHLNVMETITNYLKEMEFEVNKSKCYISSSKAKIKVTGIVLVKDGGLSIGTQLKKDIKKMIYNKLKYGIGNPDKIIGYLMFLKDIEPNTFNEYIIKYTKYSPTKDVIKDLRKVEIVSPKTKLVTIA